MNPLNLFTTAVTLSICGLEKALGKTGGFFVRVETCTFAPHNDKMFVYTR